MRLITRSSKMLLKTHLVIGCVVHYAVSLERPKRVLIIFLSKIYLKMSSLYGSQLFFSWRDSPLVGLGLPYSRGLFFSR